MTEHARMEARDPIANNADLWSVYLRAQWAFWIDPFHLMERGNAERITRAIAEVAAANVTSVLTVIAGPAIAGMYRLNAPDTTRFIHENALPPECVAIPQQYARPPRPDLTQREEWAVAVERSPAMAGSF